MQDQGKQPSSSDNSSSTSVCNIDQGYLFYLIGSGLLFEWFILEIATIARARALCRLPDFILYFDGEFG